MAMASAQKTAEEFAAVTTVALASSAVSVQKTTEEIAASAAVFVQKTSDEMPTEEIADVTVAIAPAAEEVGKGKKRRLVTSCHACHAAISVTVAMTGAKRLRPSVVALTPVRKPRSKLDDMDVMATPVHKSKRVGQTMELDSKDSPASTSTAVADSPSPCGVKTTPLTKAHNSLIQKHGLPSPGVEAHWSAISTP